MFCKWCGMESATTDVCSWCHRSLSASTTESAPAPVEASAPRATVASQPLAPEEEPEEESPLAAGLTASRPTHRPAPGRPAWAPVPRAGTAASAGSAPRPAAPVAPNPTAPTPPAAAPAVAASDAGNSARPVIGVRRPGGAPALVGSPPGAGIGVRRPAETAPAAAPASRPTPPATPAPGGRIPMPPMPARPAAPPAARPAAPAPVSARPAAPGVRSAPLNAAGGGTATLEPTNTRPAAPVHQNGAAPAAVRTPLGAENPASGLVRTEMLEEEESGGLAGGFAAAKRTPVSAGIPALGTFTATNSKYYSGQVVDTISGTHYDSATGQATSTATEKRPADNIVLEWDDDQISTPRQISKFAMAFLGILLGIGVVAHFLPDFAAIPLVVGLFAAGMLMPVMKAVPFHSDDSDDLLWLVILTLVFGPGIGLIIYGVKGLLLQDVNLAVVGLLAVSFLAYVALQLSSPYLPDDGLFNLLKLAPPWAQFTKYGYASLLYNWSGLIAMTGWIVGNVFHKLDE